MFVRYPWWNGFQEISKMFQKNRTWSPFFVSNFAFEEKKKITSVRSKVAHFFSNTLKFLYKQKSLQASSIGVKLISRALLKYFY